MKRLLAVLVLAGASVNSQILLTDSFDGSIVDSTKWDVINVTPDSSVAVQGGVLRSLNQGAIVTRNPLRGLFHFSGRFSGPSFIWFRTDGNFVSPDDPIDTGPTIIGEGVSFYGTTLAFLSWTSPEGYLHDVALLFDEPINYDLSDYEVSIYKEAGMFRIFLNGAKVKEFPYSGEFDQKIGIHANYGFAPTSLDIFEIEITAIPEPSSLSLLLAGGAVLMAGRRRNS